MNTAPKRYLAGTVAALVLALPGIGLAGGKTGNVAEPIIMVPPAPMAAPTNWTGFYGGLGIGYGRGASSTGISSGDGVFVDGNAPIGLSFNPKVSGFIGSARLGYDMQRGNFVFGGLIEGSLGKINGSSAVVITSTSGDVLNNIMLPGCESSSNTPSKCGGTSDDRTQSIDSYSAGASYTNLMSIALRAGPLVNDGNTLLYGRLGASRAKLTVTLPQDFGTVSATGTGLNAGLGVEHLLNTNVSIFAEYNYHDVGKSFSGTDIDGDAWHVRGKGLHTVGMGVNFRF
jgi:outer membrane immunogenic protein